MLNSPLSADSRSKVQQRVTDQPEVYYRLFRPASFLCCLAIRLIFQSNSGLPLFVRLILPKRVYCRGLRTDSIPHWPNRLIRRGRKLRGSPSAAAHHPDVLPEENS
uniref:Uncharacterized protein n=1 Tax=Ananas comosus var. bracteatus TaxID=296719 RepID=A0A6V7QBG6_ANACO|nr:unnamed protein product [Ananas comosus var. bracteatus]